MNYPSDKRVYKSPWLAGMLPDFPNALCAEVDPDIFFPEKFKRKEIKEAKKICMECIHKVECLSFALEEEISSGVWGGMSPQDRQRIRKAMRAAEIKMYKDDRRAS